MPFLQRAWQPIGNRCRLWIFSDNLLTPPGVLYLSLGWINLIFQFTPSRSGLWLVLRLLFYRRTIGVNKKSIDSHRYCSYNSIYGDTRRTMLYIKSIYILVTKHWHMYTHTHVYVSIKVLLVGHIITSTNDVALCTPWFFTTFQMVARRVLSAPKCNLFTRQCLQGVSKEPRGKSSFQRGALPFLQEERVTPRDKFPPRIPSTFVTQPFPPRLFHK